MKRLDDIMRSHIFFIIDCNKSIHKRIEALKDAGYQAELMLVPQVSSIKSLHKWGDHYRFQVSAAKGSSRGMFAYSIKFEPDFEDIINVDLKEFEDENYNYELIAESDDELVYLFKDKQNNETFIIKLTCKHLFGNVYSYFKASEINKINEKK